jgi:hypothetical protein
MMTRALPVTCWEGGRATMGLSIVQIAEAFSRHRFAETYPYLDNDIRWTLVGDRQLLGREEVVKTCEDSAEYLARVTTKFSRFRILNCTECVVIDSLAEYIVQNGRSSGIAACDIYDFADGRLYEISSYNIELDMLR